MRITRGSLWISAVLAAALFLPSMQGSAAPTIFFGENLTPGETVSGDPATARANFLASLSGVSTETFESFPAGPAPVLALTFTGSAGTINGTLAGGGSINDIPFVGLFATSGVKYYDNQFSPFSVSFTSPIAAFGFYGTDIGDVEGQLTLTLVGGGTQVIDIPHTIAGPSGSLLFFGIIDTENPFVSVTFTGSSVSDRFGFDDLTVGDVQQVVPALEPATLALFGVGLGAWGLTRRRKAGRR